MSFKKYLFDKFPQIFVSILGLIIMLLILNVFKVENSLKIAIMMIFISIIFFQILFDFFRRYHFYQNLKNTLKTLDQKYLVLEMLNIPGFYEGEISYQTYFCCYELIKLNLLLESLLHESTFLHIP